MGRMLCGAAIIASLGCQGAPDGALVFENVTVIPMDEERILAAQTVVIAGDRIVQMGPSDRSAPPSGATVVDGPGRFLMPGFTEMHGHLPRPDTETDEVDRILFLFLSNGVTTVRGMLGDPFHLVLREGNRRRHAPGTHALCCGARIPGHSRVDGRGGP